MTFRICRNFFWTPFSNNLATPVSSLRANINYPIRSFNYVKVVFYDDNCIALIDQFMKYFEKFAYIIKV